RYEFLFVRRSRGDSLYRSFVSSPQRTWLRDTSSQSSGLRGEVETSARGRRHYRSRKRSLSQCIQGRRIQHTIVYQRFPFQKLTSSSKRMARKYKPEWFKMLLYVIHLRTRKRCKIMSRMPLVDPNAV